jgi:hypothetical protein
MAKTRINDLAAYLAIFRLQGLLPELAKSHFAFSRALLGGNSAASILNTR